MKVKTSVTLSKEALQAIDRLAGADANRSRVIERAVLELLHRQERIERDARDLAILNRAADRLNREMADVLRDQDET
jgi:metal-responsive CopG/Arc/MetJ family transcriptional regulator